MKTRDGTLRNRFLFLRQSTSAKTLVMKIVSLFIATIFSIFTIRQIVAVGGVRLFALNSLITSVGVFIAMLELGLSAVVTNSSVELKHDVNSSELHSSLVFAVKHLLMRMAIVIVATFLLYETGKLSSIVQNLGYSASEVKWIAFAITIMALNLPFTIFSSVLLGFNLWHTVILVQIFTSPLSLLIVATDRYLNLSPGLILISGPCASLIVSILTAAYCYKTENFLIKSAIGNALQLKKFEKSSAKKLTRPYAFLIVSMAVMVNSDRIVLAHFAPLLALEQYSMLVTFFGPISALINTTSTSKWFSFASSRRAGELRLKVVMRSALHIVVAYAGFLVIGLVMFDNLRQLLWGSSVHVSKTFIALFALFALVSSLQSLFGIALASADGLHFLAGFMAIALPLDLISKAVFVHKFGADFVVIVNSLVFSIFLIMPCLYFLSRKNLTHVQSDREERIP